MLDHIELEDIRVGESNADDFILIEYRPETSSGSGLIPWRQGAFVHRSDVSSLRDWLTTWLNLHPAE